MVLILTDKKYLLNNKYIFYYINKTYKMWLDRYKGELY